MNNQDRSQFNYHRDVPFPKFKKGGYRNYRDETGESLNHPTSAFLQQFSRDDEGSRETQTKENQPNSKSRPSKMMWGGSLNPTFDIFKNEDKQPTYSKEELAGEESAERHILENLELFDY